MSHPLDGPRLKVERASEHIEILDHEWLVFFEAHSNSVSFNHTRDGARHSVSVSPPLNEPPPLRLSVICGDVFHNLRSALDHLVWQLVLAEGRKKPGRWNSFPIYTDSGSFVRDVKSRKKKRGPGPLEGIDPTGQAWAFIEDLQPYHSRKLGKDPATHQLALLSELSNTDKHRTLHVQMTFPSPHSMRRVIQWNPEAVLLAGEFCNQPLSLENETEILWVRFSETGPDPQVYVKDAFFLDPSFGNGEYQMSIALIREEILGFISTIVEDSQRFFT